MAFSYSGNPNDSDKDGVRFELGDTLRDGHLVSDEEIAYALEKEADILQAAARMAEHLAARFARETTERNANVTKDHGDKQLHFQRLARRLRRRIRSTFIDNSNKVDRFANAADTGVTQPKFRLGMHDNIRKS